jgi:hypothetical protein
MTTRQADHFWFTPLVVVAAFDLTLFLEPANLSGSSRTATGDFVVDTPSDNVKKRKPRKPVEKLSGWVGCHAYAS